MAASTAGAGVRRSPGSSPLVRRFRCPGRRRWERQFAR